MQGDHRVEKYMPTVSNAIEKHVSGQGATEIYNRAYEAVTQVITDAEKVSEKDSEVIIQYALERQKMIQTLRSIRSAGELGNATIKGRYNLQANLADQMLKELEE